MDSIFKIYILCSQFIADVPSWRNLHEGTSATTFPSVIYQEINIGYVIYNYNINASCLAQIR